MKRILVRELKKFLGEKVMLKGWVHGIRDQGKIVFIQLRDRSGIVQCVAVQDVPVKIAKSLKLESVVEIHGLCKEEKQSSSGYEVAVEELVILSTPFDELPIQVVEKAGNEPDLSLQLDYRWIDLRKPKNLLIYKVWTEVEQAFRQACIDEGLIQIHSPKLMAAASEGGAEFFEVKYFEDKAFLAQSPQFYKQMAQAAGFEGVFEIGPVFRAEQSFTTRHATEFTGYDIEVSYISSLQEIMELEERVMVHIFRHVKKVLGAEIKEVTGQEVVVPVAPFPKISMAEAKELLKEKGIASKGPGDISPEEERAISEIVKETFGEDFCFVTEYPVETRPFYHMRDGGITRSADLLYKGIEITTMAQREHRYDVLRAQAEEKGVDTESIFKYLEFFKYGCPPHGGMGIGPSRIIMKLLGLESVAEVAFVHRSPKRLTP